MKRDIGRFVDREFDLLVVGGGIGGALTAWDATMRGLSTALIEQGDFGHATSSASSKLLHGGIRFLQKLQIRLVRESLQERMVFQRIAPHNVQRKPFIIPTFGHALRGKEILVSGMLLYELLGLNKRNFHDKSKEIPYFKILSKGETLELEPGLPDHRLTGGVLFHEYQMHNSERMTLSFIRSADREGCHVINYVQARDLLRDGDSVRGVTAADMLSGDTFEIRARAVANVSGPWAFEVLRSLGKKDLSLSDFGLSKGVHLVTRPLTHGRAIALATAHKSESLLTRGGRHFFIIPWRGRSLIGTTNVPHEGKPGDLKVTHNDIGDFLEEINQAYPAASLKTDDVDFFFGGMYPLIDKEIRSEVYQGTGRFRIYDHEVKDGIKGLVTGIAGKYTTARRMAVGIVDRVFRKLARTPPPTITDSIPVLGGEMPSFQAYLDNEFKRIPDGLSEDTITELIFNHGTRYREVLGMAKGNPELRTRLSDTASTIGAEVVHAVREEMAVKLSDVIFRRTGLGTIGYPGDSAVSRVADIMGGELGWDEERITEEIREVKGRYIPST
jgi:glycerol-3-phosphate dehydrogenase